MAADGDERPPSGGSLIYRQRRPTRVWHWINALSVFVMLMSGLMIFNAHPELHWGKYGANQEGFCARHVQRALAPTREELRPRSIWQDIKDHARLRFPAGDAARHYNILQKLSYVGVLFGLLPMMVLTGSRHDLPQAPSPANARAGPNVATRDREGPRNWRSTPPLRHR